MVGSERGRTKVSLVGTIAARTVAELATRLDHPIECVPGRTNGGSASAWSRWRGPDRIMFGPALLEAPDEVQAQVAAHEVAHLVAGHRDHLGRIIAAAALLPIVWIVLPVYLGLITTAHAMSTWSLIGGALGLVSTIAFVLLWWPRRMRRQEREADTMAERWGYPFTEVCAEWVSSQESRLTKSSVYRPFRHHPSAADRVTKDSARPI